MRRLATLLLGLALAGPLDAAPIHDAVKSSQLTAVQQMLQADPNLVALPDDRGHPPLLLAVQADDLPMAQFLLEAGADPNQSDPKRWTPLHEAASRGNPALVQLLLQSGAKVDAREKQNQGTPLHIACFHGNVEICRILLRAGANINARDGERLTPLFHAKDQGHAELVKMLRQAGAR